MEGAAAAGRVFEILDTQPAPAGLTPTRRRSAHADLRADEIRLTGVAASYPGRPHPALDAVSLTIRPGEQVVLTGPSGAGHGKDLAPLGPRPPACAPAQT